MYREIIPPWKIGHRQMCRKNNTATEDRLLLDLEYDSIPLLGLSLQNSMYLKNL